VNGANISGVTFTATAVPATFSISGTVTSGGTGLAGVTMALSGAGTATVNTDSTGFYTFSGLANGSYTVTPHKAGYTLSPAGSPQTISGANIATVDFSATLPQLARIVACPLSGYTQVSVTDSGFNPATVSVAINGIVKWSNSGPSIHTVTSGTSPTADGIFNTGDIAATGLLGAACVQYLAVGSYPYFCTYHPTMTGTVTVH
jgi:plastocyanin